VKVIALHSLSIALLPIVEPKTRDPKKSPGITGGAFLKKPGRTPE